MRPIDSTRTWRSSQPADVVWAALTDTTSYEAWWPWLEQLGGGPFEAGASLVATIRAPARYRIRYVVRLTEVEPPSRVAALIEGDLGGWAGIELCPDGPGTIVRFRSSLHPRRLLLRAAGVVAEPVMVHGHDGVMDRGVAQFVTGAGVDLTRHEAPDPALRPETPGRRARDVGHAALVAGVLSGAPSTAHAVLTGNDPLAAARAAGALLGRPTVSRGVLSHAVLSVGWAAVLAAVLPRRRPAAAGALAGVLIAALDLGLVGRRIRAIRELPVVPQVVDHVAFGALVGATLDRPRRSRR
jgi:uncharacterized protein YndB with AHSA1/START domain